MHHLDVFAQAKVGELEMCSGTSWEVHQQQTVDAFPVLIEDHHICEASIGGILTNLLQSIALSWQVR